MSHCFFHCRLERETCGSADKDPQNLSTEPNPAYGHVNVTQEKEHIYDQCIVADPKKERAGYINYINYKIIMSKV